VSHWSNTLLPRDPLLDLEPWVGQRQATYRFDLTNRLTGQNLGTLTPLRSASLTHDTSRLIKRQLSIDLGVADTAAVNAVTDLISVFMVFPTGAEYPLGRYMFTDASNLVTTAGRLGNLVLNDEMFLVDQELEEPIASEGSSAEALIEQVLAGLPIQYSLESSTFTVSGSWGTGTNRGQILEALSVQGDYFSPWFDNNGVLRFIRTFDPANEIPDLDWDQGNKVIRTNIVETSDILTAPNRFIVISNDSEDPNDEVTASADVPATAPHSIVNRGFVIAHVEDLQLADTTQATAVVNGLVNRMTVFERVGINTVPDPRHDSYNVIRWDGANWLELGWTMSMGEGRTMSHLLRKAYS
jgi:hypothetical protein